MNNKLKKAEVKNETKDSNQPKETIRLYLGYAPGKTTALNGLLIRALGANKSVKIILFSKCPDNTSESNVYKVLKEKFPDTFDYYFAGVSRLRKDGTFRYFGDPDGWTSEDQALLEEGINQLKSNISSCTYDILCVDELTDLIYHNKLNENDLKEVFNNFNNNISIIITGHLCPNWLKDMATTIVEGKIIKHYQGFTKGIEF